MTIPTGRRARLILAAITATIAVAAIAAGAFASTQPGSGSPAKQTLGQLRPMAAPASWRHLTMPGGKAVLSYPLSTRTAACLR
jgi:hypothetical protein